MQKIFLDKVKHLKGAYWIIQRFLVYYQILHLSNIAIVSPHSYWHNFCNQPFFTLYFSAWEISQRFYTRVHTLYGSALCLSLSLSLFISLTSLSLSYLSLPLYISPSTFLSLSLLLCLLSIILFGVSNGLFRPWWYLITCKKGNLCFYFCVFICNSLIL